MAKYSEKLAASICELIEEGESTITEICGYLRLNRKTFYEWKAQKPAFRLAVEQAEDRCNDRLVTIARQAARRKLEGYHTTETKIVYVPDKYNPEILVVKEKVVKEKYHAPDTATINGVLKRMDERQALQRGLKTGKGQGMVVRDDTIRVSRPLVTEVVDEETKRELEMLQRGERRTPTPEMQAEWQREIQEYNKMCGVK